MPELRRRLRAAADQAFKGVAARGLRHQAVAVRQARASEIQPRGHRHAFGETAGYSAGGAVSCLTSSLRGAQRRSNPLSVSPSRETDCFASLAMTVLFSGNNRPLDLAEADAIAVALAPAAHDQ